MNKIYEEGLYIKNKMFIKLTLKKLKD